MSRRTGCSRARGAAQSMWRRRTVWTPSSPSRRRTSRAPAAAGGDGSAAAAAAGAAAAGAADADDAGRDDDAGADDAGPTDDDADAGRRRPADDGAAGRDDARRMAARDGHRLRHGRRRRDGRRLLVRWRPPRAAAPPAAVAASHPRRRRRPRADGDVRLADRGGRDLRQRRPHARPAGERGGARSTSSPRTRRTPVCLSGSAAACERAQVLIQRLLARPRPWRGNRGDGARGGGGDRAAPSGAYRTSSGGGGGGGGMWLEVRQLRRAARLPRDLQASSAATARWCAPTCQPPGTGRILFAEGRHAHRAKEAMDRRYVYEAPARIYVDSREPVPRRGPVPPREPPRGPEPPRWCRRRRRLGMGAMAGMEMRPR